MEKSSDIKKIILVTGKNSRFCSFLKKDLKKFKTYFTSKNNFNLLNFNQMKKFIKNKKITHLIHVAGLSRPMDLHEKDINLSIDLNIIGTSNIVKVCNLFKIKLIYFSTNYVYPGKTGNYKENSELLPFNNYAWSKLGGESSVHLYKDSLILRLCMTDFPFIHKKAIKGANTSFIFNKNVSKIMPFILDEFGILNIGGKKRDIYQFAKKFKKRIKFIEYRKIKSFPKDSSLNIQKLKNILKKKSFNLKNIL